MSTLSPEQRTLRARVAAFAKHAKHDPADDCAKARAALWGRYERRVDPTGDLPEEERHRRARSAMRADLARRALMATKAREQQADGAIADALLEVS